MGLLIIYILLVINLAICYGLFRHLRSMIVWISHFGYSFNMQCIGH